MPSKKFLFLAIHILAVTTTIIYLGTGGSQPRTHKQNYCYGHFHLCRFIRTITENMPFDSTDINNLLSIQYKSKVVKYRNAHFHQKAKVAEYKNRTKNKKHKSKRQISLFCKFLPFDHFSYSFKFKGVIKRNMLTLAFTIEERQLRTFHSFRLLPNILAVVTTKRTKVQCDTVDYRQRKYHIECPILEPMFVISIRGSYIPPNTYQLFCPIEDNWLIRNITSIYLQKLGYDLSSEDYPNLNLKQCTHYRVGRGLLFWMKVNGIWHLASRTCVYPFTLSISMKSCLMKKSILMLGDSLMKGRYQALVDLSNITDASFQPSLVSLYVQLKEFLLTEVNNTQTILVINNGLHYFRGMNAAVYISDMREVFRVVQDLQKQNLLRQIIWVETAAVSMNGFHLRFAKNPTIAAMNDWTNHNMRTLGVDIVPAYQISLPMHDQAADGRHYCDDFRQKCQGKHGRVNVGGAILSVLIEKICTQ